MANKTNFSVYPVWKPRSINSLENTISEEFTSLKNYISDVNKPKANNYVFTIIFHKPVLANVSTKLKDEEFLIMEYDIKKQTCKELSQKNRVAILNYHQRKKILWLDSVGKRGSIQLGSLYVTPGNNTKTLSSFTNITITATGNILFSNIINTYKNSNIKGVNQFNTFDKQNYDDFYDLYDNKYLPDKEIIKTDSNAIVFTIDKDDHNTLNFYKYVYRTGDNIIQDKYWVTDAKLNTIKCKYTGFSNINWEYLYTKNVKDTISMKISIFSDKTYELTAIGFDYYEFQTTDFISENGGQDNSYIKVTNKTNNDKYYIYKWNDEIIAVDINSKRYHHSIYFKPLIKVTTIFGMYYNKDSNLYYLVNEFE